MQSSDRDNFVKTLLGVGELYGKSISQTVIRIYWQLLEIYPWEDVVQAIKLHTQDPDVGQFMPKPADIIRIIMGNSQSQSLKALSKLERAIRHVGPYSTVVFDDIIIHAVVDEMGGWIKLCKSTQKEWPFIAKEFQTRYVAYKHQAPNQYPAKLIGITEQVNHCYGFESETAKFLDNDNKSINSLKSMIEEQKGAPHA